MQPTRYLSDREKEVMDFVVEGKPNKEVASQLGISHFTVEKHLTSIYKKLGVRNRTEAALYYKSANSSNP